MTTAAEHNLTMAVYFGIALIYRAYRHILVANSGIEFETAADLLADFGLIVNDSNQAQFQQALFESALKWSDFSVAERS